MKPNFSLIRIALAFLLVGPSGHLFAKSLYSDAEAYRSEFLVRCSHVRDIEAHKTWSPGEDSRMRIYRGVVKLATGIDAATGLRYLEDAVNDTSGTWGCFETYPFMDAILRLGKKLPRPLVDRIRMRMAESFTDDYGFTDNHMLQLHTARYLFGQTWPDGPVFADGQTPVESQQASAEWIEGGSTPPSHAACMNTIHPTIIISTYSVSPVSTNTPRTNASAKRHG